MKLVWVIGHGGMLGSALERCLTASGAVPHLPFHRLHWHDESAVVNEMRQEALRFLAAARDADSWEIYWAAGIGTMGSVANELTTETLVLRTLTLTLASALANRSRVARNGRLAFASSAGAIYAGVTGVVIDETTPAAPTTPYADAKLAQEEVLRDFAERLGMPVSIARISTAYGSSATSEKRQGLLTHIARSIVRNRAVRIFVPLDTIRDYVFVDDAASLMIVSLQSLDAPIVATKIVASQRPATISEILSIFKRVSHRAPRFVTSGAPTSSAYVRKIQFRSVAGPHWSSPPRDLVLGISAVLVAEQRRHAIGGTPRAER